MVVFHQSYILNFFNHKDPNYTLTLRLLFARYHITDGTRTSAAVELTRPKSKADVKIQIKHEEKLKKGLDHNVLIVVRYAPGKEVTTVLSLLFPKRNLFALDAALNIKVPDFDSCVVNLKIYEKIRKEYNVSISWLVIVFMISFQYPISADKLRWLMVLWSQN